MQQVVLEQRLRVTYSKTDGSSFTQDELQQLRSNLQYMPQYAASAGALIDDAHDVQVDEWSEDTSMPHPAP